jgi:YHS domain-containing protein
MRPARLLTLGLALAVSLLAAPGVAQRFVPQKDAAHPRLKYADSLLSINDRCAVREGALSPMIRPVYVNHEPVGFCCTGCPPVFVQMPEPYLARMKAHFDDPVHAGRPARIAAGLRYHVNWEIYYFADRASLAEFRKHPLQYCGRLTDPVAGVRFRPGPNSPHLVHAGRPYYFMNEKNRARFLAAPVDYAMRKGA